VDEDTFSYVCVRVGIRGDLAGSTDNISARNLRRIVRRACCRLVERDVERIAITSIAAQLGTH